MQASLHEVDCKGLSTEQMRSIRERGWNFVCRQMFKGCISDAAHDINKEKLQYLWISLYKTRARITW